ncbi:MAG: hypothetical protein CBB68_04375 [Rhodospirillaceae bacterium TMED8]|nr:hypothetical protein [Magnetovibrio sp.]OUT51570.1 MAG: hypothetical protein CBB68_04375 [Rhodospirillaceae bacterium TMED8]
MDGVTFLIEREFIVTLALVGGGLATLGSTMVNRKEQTNLAWARQMLRLGYGLTFISITLFIIAGFATAY